MYRLFLAEMQISQMEVLNNQMLVLGDDRGNIAMFDVQTAQCVARKQVCEGVGKERNMRCSRFLDCASIRRDRS